MVTAKRIKAEFQKIKAMGYVISDKPYAEKNDGALGNTFETLLGVTENNRTEADFQGWECKSQRKHTKSAASLFTRKPDFPDGGDEYMRKNWGIQDAEYPHIKVFRTSIYAHRWSVVYGKYKMKLIIDEKEEKLKINLSNLNESIIDDSVFWSFKSLKDASHKLKNTFVIKAEEKVINGKIHFKFTEGQAYMNFNFDKFIQLIQDGRIRYDNRLGIYRTGKNIGKKHNHGGGLRLVKSTDYEDIFDEFIKL
jgi:hypothetical protein